MQLTLPFPLIKKQAMKPGRLRLSPQAFDKIVEQAIARIPRPIRRHLDNIVIVVEARPSKALLKEMGLPPDEPLLGLFEGDGLLEQSPTAPSLYPATITIFEEPLMQSCASIAELTRQIEITVVHEVAHFFGIDEERLVELGYG